MKMLARIVFTATIILLLMNIWTMSVNIKEVKATGNIFIRSDGTIDPATAPISSLDGVTYAFTNTIYDEIVVEKNNIVIDGAGFSLQGTRTVNSTGMRLSGVSDVLIKRMNITGFFSAIKLEWSADVDVVGNNFTGNDFGVWLHESTRIKVTGNSFQSGWCGISLEWSRNNIVQDNKVTDSEYGILLHWSSNNEVLGNSLEDNGCGISLSWSSDNNLEGNSMVNAVRRGSYGMRLHSSARNIITENRLSNSLHGVKLIYESNENLLVANNVTDHFYGIYLSYASNNIIHHNNFVGNVNQVSSYKSLNTWDDGYPSGGNYWSDYEGVDEKHGPEQDQSGSDGIGDTPYVIGEGNRDRYPIMGGVHQPPPIIDLVFLYVISAAIVAAAVGLAYVLIRRRRKPKAPEGFRVFKQEPFSSRTRDSDSEILFTWMRE